MTDQERQKARDQLRAKNFSDDLIDVMVANFETVAVAAGGTVRTETNWPKLDSNRLVVEMPWKAVES